MKSLTAVGRFLGLKEFLDIKKYYNYNVIKVLD